MKPSRSFPSLAVFDPLRWLVGAATAASLCAVLPAWADKLTVVQVAPLSGLEATQGRAYGAGLQLAFTQANKNGSLNGHSLHLVRADDHGRAEDTLSETRRLLAEAKPIALAGYMGDQAVEGLIRSGLLDQEKLPLVGIKTIGLDVEHPQLVQVRASSKQETAKLIQHLATVGIRRIALFHEEGAKTVVATVEAQAKQSGLNLLARASYPAGSAKSSAAADQLLSADVQAIVMVSTSSAAAAFIEAYRTAGGTAQLLAHSGADIEQLSKRLSEQHTRNLAIAQVVPNPYRIHLRLTKEFNEQYAALSPAEAPISFTMMEGYIAGKLIADAVRRSGKQPSRESLRTALDAQQGTDLGGLQVGSRPVELSIVTGEGKIRQ